MSCRMSELQVCMQHLLCSRLTTQVCPAERNSVPWDCLTGPGYSEADFIAPYQMLRTQATSWLRSIILCSVQFNKFCTMKRICKIKCIVREGLSGVVHISEREHLKSVDPLHAFIASSSIQQTLAKHLLCARPWGWGRWKSKLCFYSGEGHHSERVIA